jgi:predicted metal-dependent phosphoesterase TrpH
MHNYKAKINLHLHTAWSDGWHSPQKLLKEAKKRGFLAVAITDHNEIRGSLKATKLAPRMGVIVFPAVELYFSVEGNLFELVALFDEADNLKTFFKEFRFRNYFVPSFDSIKEVDSLVRQHGGVSIAPHPYGRKGIYRHQRQNIIPEIHIEKINAFTGKARNKRAGNYLRGGKSHEFGSADLHALLSSFDQGYTQVKSFQKPITRELLWANLTNRSQEFSFLPRGESYPTLVITFQKILCLIKMIEYIPRQFIDFMYNKYLLERNEKRRLLLEENC